MHSSASPVLMRFARKGYVPSGVVPPQLAEKVEVKVETTVKVASNWKGVRWAADA